MKHILCYGDSNTWGFVPGTGARYPQTVRWTGVMAGLLGEAYCVHEEGLNARTTIFDDPYKDFVNGQKTLMSTLVSQKPIDLLILALGTNDLKYVKAWQSAQGMGQLIRMGQTADQRYPSGTPIFTQGSRILVVSPIEVDAELAARDVHDSLQTAHEESTHFAAEYGAVCQACGVFMLNAAQFASPSKVDCVHLPPEGHKALGIALADKVREIMKTI